MKLLNWNDKSGEEKHAFIVKKDCILKNFTIPHGNKFKEAVLEQKDQTISRNGRKKEK